MFIFVVHFLFLCLLSLLRLQLSPPLFTFSRKGTIYYSSWHVHTDSHSLEIIPKLWLLELSRSLTLILADSFPLMACKHQIGYSRVDWKTFTSHPQPYKVMVMLAVFVINARCWPACLSSLFQLCCCCFLSDYQRDCGCI